MVLLLAVAVGTTAGSTAPGAEQNPPVPQPTTTTTEPPPPPLPGHASSQEEFSQYQLVENEPSASSQAQLGEQFLQRYPNSGLRGNTYRLLMSAYQQLNNAEKCLEYGELYLELVPGDVEAMTLLAYGYAASRRPERAAERAAAANRLLETFEAPPTLDPTQWAGHKARLQSMNHATLGYSHLVRVRGLADKEAQQQAYEESVASYRRALGLNPRDDQSHFYLGQVLAFLGRVEEAILSYAKAVTLGGPSAGVYRAELEQLYKLTHQDSLDGLDQVLQKAAEELESRTPAFP